jgi:hypothetical protein
MQPDVSGEPREEEPAGSRRRAAPRASLRMVGTGRKRLPGPLAGLSEPAWATVTPLGRPLSWEGTTVPWAVREPFGWEQTSKLGTGSPYGT